MVVHPSGARAQVEGAILLGLSAALREEITVRGGRMEEGNFDRYRMLPISEAPAVEVHFVPHVDVLAGPGEPALPPVAPALANAIYAAPGIRLRRWPMAGAVELA